MVRREPDEGAVERDRVVRIAHDGNGDKADLADAAAREIEIGPTGAGGPSGWNSRARCALGRIAFFDSGKTG
jgi:hypothetical protein